MNLLSLTIYKKGEPIAEYTERDIRWGIIEDAMELQEKLKNMNLGQQIKEITKLVQEIFPDLTEEHRRLAYREDIMNIFQQTLAMGFGLVNEKNVDAEGSN